MMSLFGFILAIGIVVDDAIVVGENIYSEREKGRSPLDAAIKGTQRIAVPVTFAVFTTIVAFTPLLFVPGTFGQFLRNIPLIVISVLLFSLVESLFILPRHLSHLPESGHTSLPRLLRPVERLQEVVQSALRKFIEGPLDRAVRFSTAHYGLVIAGSISIMLITLGLVAGRYLSFSFLPQIEGDKVMAQVEMPQGTPTERTREIARYLEHVGRMVADSFQAELPDDHPPLLEAVYLSVGRYPSTESGPGAGALATFIESNKAEVTFRLLDAEVRDLPSGEFERAWREAVGDLAGPRSLTFSSQVMDFGAPVQIEISHPDTAVLSRAITEVQADLATYAGVFDVRNDQELGKREVELRLKPRARTLGVTVDDLGRQVRAAFFGVEAVRIQRGREEVRAYVRLPQAERDDLADIRRYRIMTPAGAAIPLEEVADVSFGTAPSTIRRIDGRRIVTVTAEVDRSVITGQEANTELTSHIIPAAQLRHPGLRYSFGGEQREQRRAMSGLFRGFALAMFVMYALLAIPFRSYVEPLIIMAAVPFGFVGAVFGHLVMGLDLGLLSIFGLVGMSGVVVNDSLVLLDFVNAEHRSGKPLPEAILSAAKVRFRPIMLTSLTTFLGVFPLIIERSLQAQFLVPMAVSLGVGILFATGIIMVLVPALTMAQHDTGERFRAWRAVPGVAGAPPGGGIGRAGGGVAAATAVVGIPGRICIIVRSSLERLTRRLQDHQIQTGRSALLAKRPVSVVVTACTDRRADSFREGPRPRLRHVEKLRVTGGQRDPDRLQGQWLVERSEALVREAHDREQADRHVRDQGAGLVRPQHLDGLVIRGDGGQLSLGQIGAHELLARRVLQRDQPNVGLVQITGLLNGRQSRRLGQDRLPRHHVRADEGNRSGAIRRDRHSGEDHVHFTALQRLDQVGERLFDDLELRFHRHGQGVGEVHFEAHRSAIPGLHVEGRLAEGHADAKGGRLDDPVQDRTVLGDDARSGNGRHERDQSGEQGNAYKTLQHCDFSPVGCDL